MHSSRPKVQFIYHEDSEPLENQLPETTTYARWRLGIALLIVLSTLPYVTCLTHDFGIADEINLTQNPLLRGRGAALGVMWRHPSIMPHFGPLAYTFFMGEYHFLGGARHATGYHLINLLTHSLNVVLLWLVFEKLRIRAALAGASIFAVHPVVAEAVAWISVQPLLLCGVFYLGSLLISLRYLGVNTIELETTGSYEPPAGWTLYVPAIVLFAAALMCNAAGITLPLVLLIILWWRPPDREGDGANRRGPALLAPMFAMSLAVAAVVWVSDHRRASAVSSAQPLTLAEHLLVAGRALWVFVGHVLAPLRLSFTYAKWPPTGAIQALALLAIVAALLLVWVMRTRWGKGPLAAALLFVAVSIPSLGLIRTDVQTYAFVADYLIYFPAAVLIGAIVAVIAERVARWDSASKTWLAPSLSTAVVVVLIALTAFRLRDYDSPKTMWASRLRTDPDSIEALNQMGLIELTQDKKPLAAMDRFRRALQLDRSSVETNLNIARVYHDSNELDKEITQYYQILSTDPNNVDAHLGLADALARQQRSADAIAEYQIVLRIQPDHLNAINNLGLLHSQRGEIEQAIQCYERAIRIDPSFTISYLNLANLQFQQNRASEAAQTLTRCLSVDPQNFEVRLNGGFMAAKEGDFGTAEKLFRQAVRLRPSSSVACGNLGIVLAQLQKFDEAVHYLQRAIELDPNDIQAQASLENARRARAKAQPPPPRGL
jgi:tetratricopeptide (TPR) repeat protein